jgi:hypothetical protein
MSLDASRLRRYSLCAIFPETTVRHVSSKREDFESQSVSPVLAIGAATMCHILCKALRLFHQRQGSALPPMDVSIIRKKFDALDASAKGRAMRLFALAGFPTIRHQFVFASTPLVTFLVDKVPVPRLVSLFALTFIQIAAANFIASKKPSGFLGGIFSNNSLLGAAQDGNLDMIAAHAANGADLNQRESNGCVLNPC